MPRKKVNWELEWFKIHNPPEQFYFEFGKTVLLSNNLFHTPTVTTNRVLSTKVVEKIFDWESANKIPKKRNFEIPRVTRLIRIFFCLLLDGP